VFSINDAVAQQICADVIPHNSVINAGPDFTICGLSVDLAGSGK
jgi:hypothetical protein